LTWIEQTDDGMFKVSFFFAATSEIFTKKYRTEQGAVLAQQRIMGTQD
jgi:hypothetical protein